MMRSTNSRYHADGLASKVEVTAATCIYGGSRSSWYSLVRHEPLSAGRPMLEWLFTGRFPPTLYLSAIVSLYICHRLLGIRLWFAVDDEHN